MYYVSIIFDFFDQLTHYISKNTRGCKRCNYVLDCAFNSSNLKWQLVEHVG